MEAPIVVTVPEEHKLIVKEESTSAVEPKARAITSIVVIPEYNPVVVAMPKAVPKILSLALDSQRGLKICLVIL